MNIHPHLSFNGHRREALSRYAEASLTRIFQSAPFGMLVDRFGTPWMLNCRQAQA